MGGVFVLWASRPGLPWRRFRPEIRPETWPETGWNKDVTEYPRSPNLAAMMFALSRRWQERPLMRGYRDGFWRAVSWGEYGVQAASAARALRSAGVAAGDRVLIASENRPEYLIAETALLAIRAVPVPAYVTDTADDHAHLLRDFGAPRRWSLPPNWRARSWPGRGARAGSISWSPWRRSRRPASPCCPGSRWSPTAARRTTSPPRPRRSPRARSPA